MNLIVDILGWIGSIMLIIAYWMVSQNKISAQSLLYQGLNIAGSILLIVNTFYYRAFPSTALNVVWVLIGLQILYKARKKEEEAPES